MKPDRFALAIRLYLLLAACGLAFGLGLLALLLGTLLFGAW